MKTGRTTRWAGTAFIVLVVNAGLLPALTWTQLFYMLNVALHLGLGLGVPVLLGWMLARRPGGRRDVIWLGCGFVLCAAPGVWLVREAIGESPRNQTVWLAHGLLAMLFALATWWRIRRVTPVPLKAAAAAAILFPAGLWLGKALTPPAKVENALVVPASMQEEGGGPKSPFWPSAAKTNVGGLIPSDFFMDSKLCGECHREIYKQWDSSAHHFSSFNNQFYRKSIEHMQEFQGSTQGSKWCAGCHDHAVFFNGRFEKPIKDQIDTPQAQTGLGCVSCHSIVHIEGAMGNGNFTIEYPRLHDLASSRNPVIRRIDRFLTFLSPAPHKRAFLKPFMRDNAEFCATCHKVHLDVPVNNYRWLRGFNDYDNWQASGVSGQGARSFYYPAEPLTCGGCHMPMVPAKDPAARNGQVHNHRFAAANTAIAAANRDETQMKAVEGLLQSGFISVDIFAAAAAEKAPGVAMLRRGGESPRAMSTFAVGEEAESGGQFFEREIGNVAAPLDAAGVRLEPGSTVRVDVVVRTRKIGHFFPGGTVDAFDVWLELIGADATGKPVFWSGAVEDGGRGPVEKGAHFYRSYMLDGAGNMINKRNASQARSLLYVRLIPPGAADVAHYRVRIPKDARGPITLHAKLNYRKFSHYYTKFSYAGEPAAGQPERVDIHHDSRDYDFDPRNIPANVSGAIKDRIPDLPIVTLAQARVQLQLAAGRDGSQWKPVVRYQDWERWNDWGIGLLLQGDLKGAQFAFERVTQARPNYADGWLNAARALIQEGQIEEAKPYLARARSIDPSLGRIYFFEAMVHKADGDYEAALAALARTAEKYPRDRVVQNQIGRLHFLKREYRPAIAALERVLRIDTEDVQAHYNLALCYRGLGDEARAARHEALFRRFKADESAQNLTGRPRLLQPEDNNERQSIHEHESVPLDHRGLRAGGAGRPGNGAKLRATVQRRNPRRGD